jgi:nucleoside-diphosphate-sugar epimerase
MMKIAITGANGFVGSTLLKHFNQAGFEPVALVRKNFHCPPVPVRIVDYTNPESVLNAIRDIDVLIHNAGKTKTVDSNAMLAANVGITRTVVQAVNRVQRPLRFIYISSQAAAGPSSIAQPLSENAFPRPLSVYGKSKAIAERIVQKQCTKPWNIVRPCSVYGEGDRDFLSLFKLSKAGFTVQIGSQERHLNMIHVSQLADFLLHLIGNQQVAGEIFFATDNQVYTQAQIAGYISEAIGKTARRITIPEFVAKTVFKCGDIWAKIRNQPSAISVEKYLELSAEGWVADTGKARKLLGWNPPPKLPELIQGTYRWYQENAWL